MPVDLPVLHDEMNRFNQFVFRIGVEPLISTTNHRDTGAAMIPISAATKVAVNRNRTRIYGSPLIKQLLCRLNV